MSLRVRLSAASPSSHVCFSHFGLFATIPHAKKQKQNLRNLEVSAGLKPNFGFATKPQAKHEVIYIFSPITNHQSPITNHYYQSLLFYQRNLPDIFMINTQNILAFYFINIRVNLGDCRSTLNFSVPTFIQIIRVIN